MQNLCYSILHFIFFIPLVPVPSVSINAPSNQTVGQSLTLESSITTVRGITSRVDIVWSSNGEELRRIMGATPNSTNDNSEVYEVTYDIPLLSTSDDGRVIECEIIIMTTPSIVATNNVTLDVTGKWCINLLAIHRKVNYVCLQKFWSEKSLSL